jgi:hypothetical protein
VKEEIMNRIQASMEEGINIYIISVDKLEGRTLHGRSFGGRKAIIKWSFKTYGMRGINSGQGLIVELETDTKTKF